MSEYQRSPLYGELSQGTRPTGRTQVRYKYYFIGGLKVLQTNIQIWENTASEELIKKIWGVVGFVGISNETRQKRKRTPKWRRQLYLLTLRKRLPLPFWTVQLQRTRMIPGRNNVPNGHTDSVSSNLLLTLFLWQNETGLCKWWFPSEFIGSVRTALFTTCQRNVDRPLRPCEW